MTAALSLRDPRVTPFGVRGGVADRTDPHIPRLRQGRAAVRRQPHGVADTAPGPLAGRPGTVSPHDRREDFRAQVQQQLRVQPVEDHTSLAPGRHESEVPQALQVP